jgi:nitronate monooxygenase
MFSFDQLKYRLIQAPMAGGPNTPEMVSEVVNAGAVGSYGFAYSKADVIERDLLAARALFETGYRGAVNANFFVFNEVQMPPFSQVEAAVCSLAEITGNPDIQAPIPPFFPDLNTQLEPVWAIRPDILSFHFGIPDTAIIEKARSLDIAVGITATCASEARQITDAGASFIVAQGIEAGGHRGIFDPQAEEERLSTIELIKVLKGKTDLPLVAAGGIMTSSKIREVITLGATAVQLGTAFLTVSESGASAAHKDYLINKTDRPTRITLGFSGRLARAINNRFIEAIADKPVLPFPLQNSLTGPMRAKAIAENNGEFQSLWAGSNFADCRHESTAELIHRLFEKCDS